MRKQSFIRKLTSVILSATIVMCFVLGDALAYTTTTSGTSTISPTNANFSSAKAPMYCNQSQTISGKIGAQYKMDIYHYEAQTGGYYAFYTTGSTDMVGAIYEEQGLINKSYKRRAFNDDAYIDPGVKNCSMVIKLDKWEDYYVCLRAFGAKTGSYTLKIEPNEDKTSYKNYGVWESQYMPDSAALTGMWYTQKIYITKQQAILYYWMMEPATVITDGTNSYTINQLQKLYKTNSTTAINFCISALTTAIGCANTAAGVGAGLLGFLLSEAISYGSSQRKSMKEILINKCGVKQTVNSKTNTGNWSATSGLCVTEFYTGTIGMLYTYDYESFNGSTLKGVKWYYGKWTF